MPWAGSPTSISPFWPAGRTWLSKKGQCSMVSRVCSFSDLQGVVGSEPEEESRPSFLLSLPSSPRRTQPSQGGPLRPPPTHLGTAPPGGPSSRLLIHQVSYALPRLFLEFGHLSHLNTLPVPLPASPLLWYPNLGGPSISPYTLRPSHGSPWSPSAVSAADSGIQGPPSLASSLLELPPGWIGRASRTWSWLLLSPLRPRAKSIPCFTSLPMSYKRQLGLPLNCGVQSQCSGC